MRRHALYLLVLLTSGCASWHGGVSVETVLRASQNVGAELQREPASLGPVFQQPLRRMQVTSSFGKRRRRNHHGVDLRASTGTPFYAAADGIVVYADDRINGYGLSVIVRHRRGFATLYAHASELRVDLGERVTRGQCLGFAGESGNATGPHLHFELRDGLKPVDPLVTLQSLKKPQTPLPQEPAILQKEPAVEPLDPEPESEPEVETDEKTPTEELTSPSP